MEVGQAAGGPACLGKPATIVAQGEVRGTAHADVIVTGPGRDRIDGRGGNDRICSGGGDDEVAGGVGSDQIDAGPGEDEVSGGNGSDRVLAGPGRDTLFGKRGNDQLLGGPGAGDFLDSGLGDDRLDGGPGGFDQVIGGVGNDRLAGGPGDGDLLRPDFGHDAIDGGAGAHDTVSFAISGQGSVVLGGGGVAVDLAAGTAGGDGAEPDTVGGIEDVVGTAFSDTIAGGPGPNVLYGGGGIDDLTGNDSGDAAFGGAAKDRCRGNEFRESCELPGVTPYSAPGEASFLELTENGGMPPAHAATLEVDLAGGPAAGSLTAVVDRPLLLEGKPGVEVAIGFVAGAWSVRVRGVAIGVGDACTVVAPEEARCPLSGTPEAVLLGGSSGEDALRIEASVPATVGAVVNGFRGTDTLEGGAGDDSLDGYLSQTRDVIRGGPGDDALTAGAVLDGGPGSDLLIAYACFGQTVVGAGGVDSVSFARSDRGVEAEVGGSARFAPESGGPALGCSPAPGFTATLIGGSVESIEGSAHGDVLRGDTGANILLGRGGDDEVRGGGGDDFVVGGLGRDALRGDAGEDRLYGRDRARDALLDCGSGGRGDVAAADGIDPRPRRCRPLG